MKHRLAPRLVVLALLASACGPDPNNLGQSPDILWWTDNESGDTNDWTTDGGGYTWSSGGGTLSLSTEHSRSGRDAIKSTVVSVGAGVQSGACAVREGVMPAEAYYSAWFYIPSAPTSTNYWLLFKYRFRQILSDSALVGGWDVDVQLDDGGVPHFVLYDHQGKRNPAPVQSVELPLGRWFQIETYLRLASDTSGQLSIWINGTLAFDLVGLATAPTRYAEWSVGAITEVIAPDNLPVYVDDAAISTRRLGPDYPVFWRGSNP
jgi:hypothetical protein